MEVGDGLLEGVVTLLIEYVVENFGQAELSSIVQTFDQ